MRQKNKWFQRMRVNRRRHESVHAALPALLLIALFTIQAPLPAQPSREITVSAAISLKNAFEEIGRAFERKAGAKVVFNFGGSGALMQQIVQGAPVDVFAPAAQKDMDDLAAQGLIDMPTIARVALNRLVLIVPKDASAQNVSSFAALGTPAIRRVAVGNPKTVPAGRYARETFAYYHLLPAVEEKLIYTENVRQALDYVARREVDAGVVYATDARARASDVRVAAQAPEAGHSPIVYPIAVVRGSSHGAEARAFIAFVRSPEAEKILQRYGFTTDK